MRNILRPHPAAAAKSLQSCPTLCDPRDGSPPGSPVPGIFQARTLEWVAISLSNAWKWKVKVRSLSRAQLFVTPWTAAYQAPLSVGFSGQEYWNGFPLPSPHPNLCTCEKKKSLKHRCFYDYTVINVAKLRRSVILNVGKDLSYITDGSVKWCGPFGKLGFPGGSDGRESTCNAGDLGSIPGFGRSLEASTATHSSILASRIPMDKGTWWATIHGVTKSQTRLND